MKEKKVLSLDQVHRLINFGPLLLVAAAFENQRTIAPIAWTTPLSQNPPYVGVAVGQNHLSHFLINQSNEFSLNLPGSELIKAVVYCGSVSGEKEDKFLKAGLTPLKAQIIEAPLIGECLAHLECQVTEKIPVGDHTLFIGKVVSAQVDAEIFRPEGIIDVKKAKTLHHLGGRYFAVLKEELSFL